tara:strand:+ start:1052 stop:1726 length:675 start_codon:yes stop_codon:yes gene_type:complete
MKISNKSISGTSYHGTSINCTPSQLLQVFFKLDKRRGTQDDGEYTYDYPNTGEDKTNIEFVFETSEGYVFTVYDWKEYKKLKDDVHYDFNIGGQSSSVTEMALKELTEELKNLPGSFTTKGTENKTYTKKEESFKVEDAKNIVEENPTHDRDEVETIIKDWVWTDRKCLLWADFYHCKIKSKFGRVLVKRDGWESTQDYLSAFRSKESKLLVFKVLYNELGFGG